MSQVNMRTRSLGENEKRLANVWSGLVVESGAWTGRGRERAGTDSRNE